MGLELEEQVQNVYEKQNHTRATTNFKGGTITFNVIGERGIECRWQ
jgi:hypothetical protein